jgi:hypothetical protein
MFSLFVLEKTLFLPLITACMAMIHTVVCGVFWADETIFALTFPERTATSK